MPPIKIAYTVSSSYSGSTLLSMLLNAQPDIGTISEFDGHGDIPRDPDFRCSCGQPIRQCPFFHAVEERMRARGFDFNVENIQEMLVVHRNPVVDRMLVGRVPYISSPGLESLRDRLAPLLPGYRRLVGRFYNRNEALMRSVLEQKGASVFLDANKDPHRMLLLARRFDVHPIYIYKNGVAGTFSYIKNAAALGLNRTPTQAARRWFREQLAIAHALRRFQGDHLQVSYSQLCSDVEGTLKRIAAFLGIEFREILDLAGMEHHIIGNRMRLKGLTEVREDQKWKERMSDADIAEYRQVYEQFAPALRRLNPEVFAHIWH